MTIHMDKTIYNVATLVVDAFQVSTTTTTTTAFIRHNFKRRDAKVHNNYYSRRTHDNDDDDDNITNYDDDNDDMMSNNILRHRMYPLQIATLEQIYQRSLPISTTTTARTTSTSLSSSPDSNDNSNNHYNMNKNIHSTHHPIPFIEFCLHCLLQNDIPYPDSGIRFLLRVSTKTWKEQIYQSIGYHRNKAIPQHHQQRRRSRNSTFRNNDENDNNNNNAIPMHYDHDDTDRSEGEEEMISAISATISQVQNQFGILVGEGEPYRICFPSEPLEYDIQSDTIMIHNHHDDSKSNNNNVPQPSSTITTSTVWIECQLRHYDTNELLVIMGWQLLVVPTLSPTPTPYNDDDDPKKYHSLHDIKEYRIDRVDWQDFREMFRPGIGREEWIRICG